MVHSCSDFVGAKPCRNRFHWKLKCHSSLHKPTEEKRDVECWDRPLGQARTFAWQHGTRDIVCAWPRAACNLISYCVLHAHNYRNFARSRFHQPVVTCEFHHLPPIHPERKKTENVSIIWSEVKLNASCTFVFYFYHFWYLGRKFLFLAQVG